MVSISHGWQIPFRVHLHPIDALAGTFQGYLNSVDASVGATGNSLFYDVMVRTITSNDNNILNE